MRFKTQILSNGLTVVKVPSSDAESVVVDFFVKTGSRSERPEESGISHFLEHFLFKGTKKYPSALAISELVDSIGGEMNANTGKEHTQFFIKASSQYLTLVFEVLTDMLSNPLLDARELEREKGVIVEEINMYKDTPTAEIHNVLESTMWPGHALGRDIAGSKETVAKFNRQMFRDYMHRHYQMPNMILGVSGKFDDEVLERLIKKYWSRAPRREFGGWEKVGGKQTAPRVKVDYKKTEQAHLALGFKGLSYEDPRNYPLMVLSAILGGGMSSRLFIEVRERRGLAYYVRAGAGNYQDTGAFVIGSGVKVDKIEEALLVIANELRCAKKDKVPPKELLKAKEYLKGRTTLALEDNQARLDWYLEEKAFHRKVLTPREVFRAIDKVSAFDIKKIASEILNRNNATLAVIGPYKGKDKAFLRLLKV